MRMLIRVVFLSLICSVDNANAAAETVVIAHFGDSTVACTYLKPEQRVNALLQAKLEKQFVKKKITCVNVAKDGEFIRQFLDGGLGLDKRKHKERYTSQVKAKLKKLDIALIRYGQNDWKLAQRKDISPGGYSPEAFKKDLLRLTDRITKDYPGVTIVLETGTYFGDGGWTDKNSQKYWEAVRNLAKEKKFPLIDNHMRWAKEDKDGAKTLRQGGHPTDKGVRIQADEAFIVLQALLVGNDQKKSPKGKRSDADEKSTKPKKSKKGTP